MSNGFKVGASREVITPPVGAVLSGYIPPRKAESVNDDLAVTAVAFAEGEKRALLLSADVCLLDEETIRRMKEEISRVTSVPRDSMIIAAIHTHSGPMCWDDQADPIDQEYINTILIPQTVRAAEQALKNLRQARMGIGTVKSEVGVNRRQIEPDGSILLGQNPWGCHDPVMTVIAFQTPEEEPIVNLIHYGAHCTAAGSSREITRDWPGPMVDRLTQETGAITMFINGASGDVGPRLSNGETCAGWEGDISLVKEMGDIAEVDAVRAYHAIDGFTEVDMDVVSDEVRLPYAPLMTREQAEEALEQFPDPNTLQNWDIIRYQKILDVLKEHDKGTYQTHMRYEQNLIRVGEVVFVPFPFEIFSEITLRLRAYSPYRHTLCLGNANGNHSYLPSQDQICRGGYEVDTFRLRGTYTLRDDTDNSIIAENLRILEKLR